MPRTEEPKAAALEGARQEEQERLRLPPHARNMEMGRTQADEREWEEIIDTRKVVWTNWRTNRELKPRAVDKP
jgi:hypothetical protein